jgi:hypothetical protein
MTTAITQATVTPRGVTPADDEAPANGFWESLIAGNFSPQQHAGNVRQNVICRKQKLEHQ